jgi:hypothetical protein
VRSDQRDGEVSRVGAGTQIATAPNTFMTGMTLRVDGGKPLI